MAESEHDTATWFALSEGDLRAILREAYAGASPDAIVSDLLMGATVVWETETWWED